MNAAKLFFDKGEYEDSLLIHIMGFLAPRQNEILTLRFVDFQDRNNKKSIL